MSIDATLDIGPKPLETYLQKYNWDCGLRTVAIAIAAKTGRKVDIKGLKLALNATRAEGTDILAIEDYFAGRPEFNARANTGWTLNELKEEIDKGKVCIVAYQNWQKPADKGEPEWGHYGIVYKIDDERVYLFDPGSDKTRGEKDFSTQDFIERWYEMDYDRNRVNIPYQQWALTLDLNREVIH